MNSLWSCASRRTDHEENLPKNNNTVPQKSDGNSSTLVRYALCTVHAQRSPTTRNSDGQKPTNNRTGTGRTGRRPLFQLPPLALLPCGERQADPSPPMSTWEDEKLNDNGRNGVANHTTVSKAGDGGSSWSGSNHVEAISERYSVISVIGRGTFGRILLAECRATGKKTALKVGLKWLIRSCSNFPPGRQAQLYN